MKNSAGAHRVLVTRGAERDLQSIDAHVRRDSEAAADRLLDRLQSLIESLSQFPDRGNFPKELIALGIRDFRQVVMKPYRVIYRVVDRDVAILLIADGRRDMQSLLARRLLES